MDWLELTVLTTTEGSELVSQMNQYQESQFDHQLVYV